jgi:hypothetical protein
MAGGANRLVALYHLAHTLHTALGWRSAKASGTNQQTDDLTWAAWKNPHGSMPTPPILTGSLKGFLWMLNLFSEIQKSVFPKKFCNFSKAA